MKNEKMKQEKVKIPNAFAFGILASSEWRGLLKTMHFFCIPALLFSVELHEHGRGTGAP